MDDRGTSAWWWLPAVVTAGLTWTVYLLAADAERGSRAGAEPVMAGIFSAYPFFALLLLEVLCAISAEVSETRVGRTRSLWCATAGAVLVAGLVLAVAVPDAAQGYLSVERAAWVGCLVAALLLSLAPAWLSHVRHGPSRVERPSA